MPLADRDNLPGSTTASGRRDAAAMVGPGHPAHDTGAAWALLAGDHLGARIDAEIQHPRPPPSRRLVQQAPTNLQRRDRRRAPRLVVATEFFHVPGRLRKHRNSGHLVKSIRGDSMSRRMKCGKSSLGSKQEGLMVFI